MTIMMMMNMKMTMMMKMMMIMAGDAGAAQCLPQALGRLRLLFAPHKAHPGAPGEVRLSQPWGSGPEGWDRPGFQ